MIAPFEIFAQNPSACPGPGVESGVVCIGIAVSIREAISKIAEHGRGKGEYIVVSLKTGHKVRIQASDIGSEPSLE